MFAKRDKTPAFTQLTELDEIAPQTGWEKFKTGLYTVGRLAGDAATTFAFGYGLRQALNLVIPVDLDFAFPVFALLISGGAGYGIKLLLNMLNRRQVDMTAISRAALEMSGQYSEVSAKTRSEVEELFREYDEDNQKLKVLVDQGKVSNQQSIEHALKLVQNVQKNAYELVLKTNQPKDVIEKARKSYEDAIRATNALFKAVEENKTIINTMSKNEKKPLTVGAAVATKTTTTKVASGTKKISGSGGTVQKQASPALLPAMKQIAWHPPAATTTKPTTIPSNTAKPSSVPATKVPSKSKQAPATPSKPVRSASSKAKQVAAAKQAIALNKDVTVRPRTRVGK